MFVESDLCKRQSAPDTNTEKQNTETYYYNFDQVFC